MYESPIQMVISNVVNEVYKKQEEYVMQCVRNIGIDIDKEELLKAIQYDRNQYSKGYADGKAEMREKIDKVMEEIEQEYIYIDYNTNHKLSASYGLRKALDILKNI